MRGQRQSHLKIVHVHLLTVRVAFIHSPRYRNNHILLLLIDSTVVSKALR